MSKFDLSRKYRTGQLSPEQYQIESSFYNYSSIIDKDNVTFPLSDRIASKLNAVGTILSQELFIGTWSK